MFIFNILKSVFSYIFKFLFVCVHVCAHDAHVAIAQSMQICSCECSALGGQKRATGFL